MTTPPHRLDHQLDRSALTCRALIESPAGSRAKFDLNIEHGLYELRGILPAGIAFPLDFGFVPSTLAEDGDPLDILILSEAALPVGCLVTARLLGVIEAKQTEEVDGRPNTVRNDRLVGRLAQSRAFANVETLEQLGEGFAKDLHRFFETYNDLKGNRFEVVSIAGPPRAVELIEQAGERLRSCRTR